MGGEDLNGKYNAEWFNPTINNELKSWLFTRISLVGLL
ncbi:hypothetical protein EDF82_3329 [Raoultella sp. BIGb0399]|nr:hypothetical protein EDF82_3329 [Raoultella sp. BIGb0399]